jgi:hypothetical protein
MVAPTTGAVFPERSAVSPISRIFNLPRITSMTMNKTYSPKPGDVERAWLVVDATDLPLGRRERREGGRHL